MTSRLFGLSNSIRALLRPLGIERTHFLKPIYRKFKQALKQRTAQVDGFTLHLDTHDSLDLSLSPDYESFERSLLKEWIQEGDIVLDIGAHIGLFTLIMSRLVGPSGQVYSFEPFPDSYRLLVENLQANGVENATVLQAAVGAVNNRASLFLNPENSGDHGMFDPDGHRFALEVDSIRLDDFEPLKDRLVSFIKMDIQGAEGEALKGMNELLNRNPGIRIFFEFWPSGLEKSGTEPINVLSFFFDREFKLFHVNEDRGDIQEIPRDESGPWLEQLKEGFQGQQERHTNLLAVKRERKLTD